MDKFLDMIANDLAAKGKYIKPSSNSILIGLEMANDNPDVLNVFAGQIAVKTANVINYIRNTIKPVYADVLKYIDENSSKFDKPTVTDKMTIVEFTGSAFLEELKKGNRLGNPRALSLTPPTFEFSASLPEEPAELERLFVYDDMSLQALAEPAIKRLGVKNLENIYSNVLNPGSYASEIGLFKSMFKDPITYLDYIVAAYILVNNLYKVEKPVYVVCDNDAYKRQLTWLVEEFSNLASIAVRDIEGFKKSGVVVLGVKDKVITVIKDNYEKFLADGGSVETILGHSLLIPEERTRATTFASSLLSKKLAYEANWAKMVEMERLDQANVNIGKYRALYGAAVAYTLNNLVSAKLLEEKGTTPAEVTEKFMEYVNELPAMKLVEKQIVVSKLVGKYIFDCDAFKTITQSMVGYAKLTDLPPEVTIKYAALDYVMDYLLEQVSSEKAELKLRA